jgi:transcriptional regulator with XRE-family HTH domain
VSKIVRPGIYLRVLDLMDEQGISRRDLQKRTGWHEMKLWRLLSGRTQFKIKDLVKLSKIFNCELAAFFYERAA